MLGVVGVVAFIIVLLFCVFYCKNINNFKNDLETLTTNLAQNAYVIEALNLTGGQIIPAVFSDDFRKPSCICLSNPAISNPVHQVPFLLLGYLNNNFQQNNLKPEETARLLICCQKIDSATGKEKEDFQRTFFNI